MAFDLSKELPGILSSLLSSPEVLGKLLSTLGGSAAEGDTIEVAAEADGREDGAAAGETGSEPPTLTLPTASDAIAASAESRGRRREGLLRALRPYLSPQRCERLDTLVRVSSVLDSIKGNY